MRLLVFQHSVGEPPAAFGRHAAEHGDDMTVVRLFAGDGIPTLAGFDALLVMGGPMDVWDTVDYPWLRTEITAIASWVSSGRPYLGICLGHQLLAEAMGGKCARMTSPEIAVSDVTLDGAQNDPLFRGLPNRFQAMHWHGVEVATVPDKAQVLGHSAGCANQVMRVGNAAWGLQFHPELVPGTVTTWMDDPANVACATDWLGSTAAAWDFVAASEAQATGFIERSKLIYSNFRTLTQPRS